MLNFNFLQFGEILGILPNTIAQAATSFESKISWDYLILPAIEIPKWFKFNHHQSVGNSASFLVGPKFSNLVVCIAFPSRDVNTNILAFWLVNIFVNGCKQQIQSRTNVNYDHVWLIYGKVNISNPSEENCIEVEVIPTKYFTNASEENLEYIPEENISLNRLRIYVECICCPQKPNMDQWASNNGEEDLGRVGIPHRLRRRNHQPIHARRPQKHCLYRFRWFRIRFQPWKQRFTKGFHD